MSFTGKSQTFLETTITNDGFFPDLVLGEFQRLYRVPAEHSPETVIHHLGVAIDNCNQVLAKQKELWVLAGASTLAGVPAELVGDVSALTLQYKRAVYCQAMGILVRAFATMNRKAEAENLAKEGERTEDDYYTQSNHAIRRLLGKSGTITAVLL